MAEATLRNFTPVVADAYRRIGRAEGATKAYAAAQQLVNDALASPDLTASTRVKLGRLSSQKSFTLANDDIKPRFPFRCNGRLTRKCSLSLVR
jgi:hypothetical protein